LRAPKCPKAASRDPIYRRRRYSPELIEQCVRWYLTYRLSYRDLTAMMAERDVTVSHTTIMRWVRHYVPEYERRWCRFSKPTHSSWRMDETSVSVGGRWNYLYRAADKYGKSVHSLLREDRTIGSAQEFFRQAVKVSGSPWPEKPAERAFLGALSVRPGRERLGATSSCAALP
jgi:transposase-like protein